MKLNYDSANATKPTPAYGLLGLIVEDFRGQPKSDWNVTVKAGGFTAAGTASLQGYELYLEKPDAVGHASGTTAPIAESVTLKEGMTTGEKIFHASNTPSASGGNWNPFLYVPDGFATVANHEVTLTWNVSQGA